MQWDKPKLKWFSYKSNPNLQKLVDIFHNDNFYGVHMKSKITTEKERIEKQKEAQIKEDAEYKIFLKKYKKRAIDDHGEWTDKDKENFGRLWFEHRCGHD